MSVLHTRANQKVSTRKRANIISVLLTRANKKGLFVNACSLKKIEPKIVHISVNTIEVKDATKKTKYEEPSVTDNSVNNVLSYFKILECGKKLLIKLGATCERACMATLKKMYETELLRY